MEIRDDPDTHLSRNDFTIKLAYQCRFPAMLPELKQCLVARIPELSSEVSETVQFLRIQPVPLLRAIQVLQLKILDQPPVRIPAA